MRTWAIKGESPVAQFHFNWDHISVIAGMHFSGACFRIYEGAVKKEQVVGFLKALGTHFRQPLLILWDGARPHHSRLVRNYVDSTKGHIQISFLPPYAPELNPVEYLWGWLKRHAVANFCPDTLDELTQTARTKLKSGQRQRAIIACCCCKGTVMSNVLSALTLSRNCRVATSAGCPRAYRATSLLL